MNEYDKKMACAVVIKQMNKPAAKCSKAGFHRLSGKLSLRQVQQARALHPRRANTRP